MIQTTTQGSWATCSVAGRGGAVRRAGRCFAPGRFCVPALPSINVLPKDCNPQDADGLMGHEHRQETLDFRFWFDENQKIMSCAKATRWCEDKVKELAAVDPGFLSRYRTQSVEPSSPHVAKCWMREMGVERCRTVKNYCVKRHESKKAQRQRAECVPWSFRNELHCKSQIGANNVMI